MSLQEIALDLTPVELPPAVERLLVDAGKRIDRLFETEQNKRLPRYIPSDPKPLYRALRFLDEHDLPLGRVYCEWGSGFGVGAGMAALLGYEAYGIELEESLIAESRALADRNRLTVEFFQTSFYPEGFESYTGQGGTELVHPENMAGDVHAALNYEGMPVPIDEIDVFYVFPWPSEHELMLELFESIAVEGAILLICFGENDLCAFRKI